jgi:peroxiredoxin Q/BCP
VKPARHFRTLAATARAAATGLANVALGRVEAGTADLQAGDRAPDFSLPGTDGQMHTLSDELTRRPVVLVWFPRAFTPGCTAECRSLAEHHDEAGDLPATVLAASVDAPATNAEFAQSLEFPYPILSDETTAVARAYGVLSSTGFPSRWTFYIGRDGRILDIDRQVKAAFHGRDVAARLHALGIS